MSRLFKDQNVVRDPDQRTIEIPAKSHHVFGINIIIEIFKCLIEIEASKRSKRSLNLKISSSCFTSTCDSFFKN